MAFATAASKCCCLSAAAFLILLASVSGFGGATGGFFGVSGTRVHGFEGLPGVHGMHWGSFVGAAVHAAPGNGLAVHLPWLPWRPDHPAYSPGDPGLIRALSTTTGVGFPSLTPGNLTSRSAAHLLQTSTTLELLPGSPLQVQLTPLHSLLQWHPMESQLSPHAQLLPVLSEPAPPQSSAWRSQPELELWSHLYEGLRPRHRGPPWPRRFLRQQQRTAAACVSLFSPVMLCMLCIHVLHLYNCSCMLSHLSVEQCTHLFCQQSTTAARFSMDSSQMCWVMQSAVLHLHQCTSCTLTQCAASMQLLRMHPACQ
jgi:hypothetical protein